MVDGFVEKLRSIHWPKYKVVYAILFGSAMRCNKPRDIDVAVMFSSNPDLSDIVRLADEISKTIGYPLEKIDIVPLNRDIPCELFLEIVKGIPLYVDDFNMYIDDLCRRIMLCYDMSIISRKLKVLETALKTIKARSRKSRVS